MSAERFDRIEARLDGVQEHVSELQGQVSELQGQVSDLQGNVSQLQGDVSQLRGDVSHLQGDMSHLQDDVTDLKNGQARLEQKVHVLHEDVIDRIKALEPGAELKLAMQRESAALRERLERYEAENQDAHRYFKARLDK